MKLSSFARSAVGVAVLAAAGANAATVSYTDSFALTKADWATTLLVNQFNASLGTLTSVTINFTSNVTLEGGLDSESGTQFNNAKLASNIDFILTEATGYVGGDLSGGAATALATQTLRADADAASNYTGSGASNDDMVVGPTNSVYTSSSSVVAGDFGLFIGGGTYSFDLETAGSLTLTAPTNYNSYANNFADALIEVVYTYTEAPPPPPVPEPEGYALMLAGLAAVGAMSRRRRMG